MAAADMMVTVAGAGAKTGVDWADAMGLAEWITDLASTEAGDRYFLEAGTYTLTGAISALNDGTAGNPISIIGVASGTTAEPPTSADWPTTDAARPLIAAGANAIQFDNFWRFLNLRFTGTAGTMLWADTSAFFWFVKVENSSGSGGRVAFRASQTAGRLTLCEGVSTNGIAFNILGATTYVNACYAHDSVTGFSSNNPNQTIINSVIDTCSTVGITLSGDSGVIDGCVFYGNGIAIDLNTGTENLITNNALKLNTTGVFADASNDTNFLDYNIFDTDNTADVTNVTKGPNTVSAAINFTAPADANFALLLTSNAIDAGLGLGIEHGLAADTERAMGVDQPGSGGGGGGAIVNQGLHAIESGIMA